MRRLLGLEHLTLLDVAPPRLVSLAAQAGFKAVGLRICPVTNDEPGWPMSPGSPMLAQTVRLCSDAGVEVLDVEAIRLGPAVSPAGYEPALHAAAELGAWHVNALCEDPDLGRLADRFAELVTAARPFRIRPVIEFMAYRSVRTLADAVAVVGPSGGGGLLIDALHVQRCGVDLADLAAVDPSLIAYLQLCDAPLKSPDDELHEARAARLLPGAGELPLRGLLAALPADIPAAVEAPGQHAAANAEHADDADFAEAARRALGTVLAQDTREQP
jgi:sugar phosphate isomerase/epimerase